MAHRVFNFNPGPSTLPLEVLKKVQEELLDYKGTGMSVMEISHRSAEYEEINDATIALVRELMGLNEKYHVLFMTGGAISFLFQASILSWVLTWIVTALAALNAFGGFCVGCAMYYWLNRLNIPGFYKAPPAGTFPGMRPKTGHGL